jgi:hypothetical protein
MARPQIEPVTAANLDEFCTFLHDNLNPAITADGFRQGLTRSWHVEPPNHGFAVRDAGRMVGGIGAIYAERPLTGARERFCNITGWCVLESHRAQSMRLAMAVTSQKGWHFTDLSPTKVVGSMLQFLKFQALDERQAVLLNMPGLPGLPGLGTTVLHRPGDIEAALHGDALEVYRDHAGFPWLRHALVGRPGHWCHVIYKRREFKGLPTASILYLSDPGVFRRGWRRLGAHFLARGMVSTQVEARWLGQPPWPSAIRSGFNAKLFLSDRLQPAQIDVLYSETVALDL